jgi:hypothetical protein
MNALDDYIERAGSGAVLMVSQAAMDDIRYNTPSESWLHDGLRDFYRGALIELHDEWSWGWMVRKADGRYVEPAIAAAARQGGDVQQAPGEAPQSGGDSRIAQHGSGG